MTPQDTQDAARRRVSVELKQRGGWSIRHLAAQAVSHDAPVTNTTLERWMKGTGEPTPTVRRAIAAAFGWPADWPENPPDGEAAPPPLNGSAALLTEILEEIRSQRARDLELLAAEVKRLRRDVDGFLNIRADQYAWLVQAIAGLAERAGMPVPDPIPVATPRRLGASGTSSRARRTSRSEPDTARRR